MKLQGAPADHAYPPRRSLQRVVRSPGASAYTADGDTTDHDATSSAWSLRVSVPARTTSKNLVLVRIIGRENARIGQSAAGLLTIPYSIAFSCGQQRRVVPDLRASCGVSIVDHRVWTMPADRRPLLPLP